MALYRKEKDKETLNNPSNCWNLFIKYVLFALMSAILILALVFQLIAQYNASELPLSISVYSIVQTSCIAVSLVGFFIFLIKPFLNLLKYIFEEISENESFTKNIKALLRSQWFLIWFHLSILCSRDVMGSNLLCLVLVIFNLMVDLFNSRTQFAGNLVPYLDYVSYALCILVIPFSGSLTMSLVFLIIKLTINYMMREVRGFVKGVMDEKIVKQLSLLNTLTIINVYMFCFVFLGNYRNFVSVDSDNAMLSALGRIVYMLFVPNIAKMVTWFL